MHRLWRLHNRLQRWRQEHALHELSPPGSKQWNRYLHSSTGGLGGKAPRGRVANTRQAIQRAISGIIHARRRLRGPFGRRAWDAGDSAAIGASRPVALAQSRNRIHGQRRLLRNRLQRGVSNQRPGIRQSPRQLLATQCSRSHDCRRYPLQPESTITSENDHRRSVLPQRLRRCRHGSLRGDGRRTH